MRLIKLLGPSALTHPFLSGRVIRIFTFESFETSLFRIEGRSTPPEEAYDEALRRIREAEETCIGDLVSYLESLPTGDDPMQPIFPSLFALKVSGSRGLSQLFAGEMVRADVASPLGAVKTGRGRQFKTLSFHSLRHSFVSRMAEGEISSDVGGMTGHLSNAVAKMPSLL